jgi:hypothetical protein
MTRRNFGHIRGECGCYQLEPASVLNGLAVNGIATAVVTNLHFRDTGCNEATDFIAKFILAMIYPKQERACKAEKGYEGYWFGDAFHRCPHLWRPVGWLNRLVSKVTWAI